MSKCFNFDTYELAERHCSANEKRNHRGIAADLAHIVDADPFIRQLQVLHIATDDHRFIDAVDALRERGLVSGMKWTAATPFPPANDIEERVDTCAVGMVKILIDESVSLRLAIANAVANLGWPGNSFEAATKSLERLWRGSWISKV